MGGDALIASLDDDEDFDFDYSVAVAKVRALEANARSAREVKSVLEDGDARDNRVRTRERVFAVRPDELGTARASPSSSTDFTSRALRAFASSARTLATATE